MDEQDKCKYYLGLKETGYSALGYYKKFWRKYIRTGLYFLLTIVLLVTDYGELQPLWIMIFGLHIGRMTRDIAWVRATKKAWPITLKLLDWDKINKIAKGESLDTEAGK